MRGWWLSYKSLVRYEKAGRVQFSAAQCPLPLQSNLAACEERLGGLLLGSTTKSHSRRDATWESFVLERLAYLP